MRLPAEYYTSKMVQHEDITGGITQICGHSRQNLKMEILAMEGSTSPQQITAPATVHTNSG